MCGQFHRAKNTHPREEVAAAINKVKGRLPTALITIFALAYIVDICANTDDEADERDEDIVEWAEEGGTRPMLKDCLRSSHRLIS